MSNHINNRRGDRKRRTERRGAHSCGGEGRNGAIGKSAWKALSRRSERRAAGKKLPAIQKRKGRPVLTTD